MRRGIVPLSLVILASSAGAEAQIPPPPLKNVVVRASVGYDEATRVFTYRYLVSNPTENGLPVDMLDVDITLPPGSKTDESTDPLPKGSCFRDPWQEFPPLDSAPFPWRTPAQAQKDTTGITCIRVGLACPSPWQNAFVGPVYKYQQIGFVCAASWSRDFDDTTPRILPGQTKDGFELTSRALPGIRNAEAETNVTELADAGRLPPAWTETEDDTDEEIVAKAAKAEVLNCKTATIGPTGIPPFVPVGFSQMIRGYLNRSAELGWLTDATLATNLRALLDQLDGLLAQQKYEEALPVLQSFKSLVHGALPSQRSPEADALLYYNAEFLRTQILDMIPVSWFLTPSESTHAVGDTQVFEVRSVRGPNPEPYTPFRPALSRS